VWLISYDGAGAAFALLFKSKIKSFLTTHFIAIVLKRILLWIFITTKKYAWQNWDQEKKSR